MEPVYQYQLANGNWIDQTKESYDYNVKHGNANVRALFATPQEAAAQPSQAVEHCLWARNGHQPCQHTQAAPRRLTEAEITLLVEAYYEDFGSAPPDLIRQVESLILVLLTMEMQIESPYFQKNITSKVIY